MGRVGKNFCACTSIAGPVDGQVCSGSTWTTANWTCLILMMAAVILTRSFFYNFEQSISEMICHAITSRPLLHTEQGVESED